MMSSTFTLALKAPLPLPAEGVTSVGFKAHINSLIPFLEQDVTNYYFLKDGIYSQWGARQDGHRISDLTAEDSDKKSLDKQKTDETITEDQHEVKIGQLLLKRNSQLSKFIQLIVVSCHYTEHTDITELSTSFEWIVRYLQRHYNIETKGAHFMNISKIYFKKGMLPQTFYKQHRAAFQDNLRKAGEILLHKNNLVLAEDETLNSSFESAIVLWTLEKIDSRLPAKVAKLYGHQMTGNKTLFDLHSTIFQDVPSILLELDAEESKTALGATKLEDKEENTQLNFFGGDSKYQRGKFTSRGRGRGENKFGRKAGWKSKPSSVPSKTFCRFCKLAGSSPSFYNSHEIGECKMLTRRDLESITKLNNIGEDDCEDGPTPFYESGWDDQESGEEEAPR